MVAKYLTAAEKQLFGWLVQSNSFWVAKGGVGLGLVATAWKTVPYNFNFLRGKNHIQKYHKDIKDAENI